MLDVIFIAAIAIFFAATILYVYACERLQPGASRERK
jgi:hypothetical protein